MKLRLPILLLCVFSFLFTNPADAQGITSYRIGGEEAFALPIGSLSEWFKPAYGTRIIAGQRTGKNLIWSGVIEAMVFKKGNDAKLFFPDLEVSLEQYGAGIQLQYFFAEEIPFVQPYLTAGTTLYRWFSKRGKHATDSTSTLTVPELLQSDWSFGFYAGGGFDVPIAGGLSADFNFRYAMLAAELWPALALRLENVSGFQTLQASAGLRFDFDF